VLPEVIAMNDKLEDMTSARQDLDNIYIILQDERRIQGLDVACP